MVSLKNYYNLKYRIIKTINIPTGGIFPFVT